MARVLFVVQDIGTRSGWALVALETIRQARAAGHEIEVIAHESFDSCPIDGIKVYPVLKSGGIGAKYLIALAWNFLQVSNLRLKKPDVIHFIVETYWPLVYLFRNCPKKIALLCGTYSVVPYFKIWTKWIYSRVIYHFDIIHSISGYTADRFRQASNFQGNVFVTNLGVNLDRFEIESSELPQKEMAFCTVGHIKPRKGVLYALKAFKIVLEDFPQAKFKIVGSRGRQERGYGSDVYAQECISFLQENGMEEAVEFLGLVSDEIVNEVYRTSIGNILASVNDGHHFEGFGLVHIEANACGTPTIGSRNCGNEDCIEDGVSGFLCEQANPEDLAAKMKFYCRKFVDEELGLVAINCVKHAQKYTWKRYFQEIEELYLS